MEKIEVNFTNLSKSERQMLLELVAKSNKTKKKLSEIENGKCYKIGDFVFIKMYSEIYQEHLAVMKECVFRF